MKKPLMIAGASAIVIVLAMVYIARAWHPDNNANFPEGTAYICLNCGHTWTMTMKELGEHHRAHFGQPLDCPKCGSTNTAHAVQCANCGTIFKADYGGGGTCPKCGKSVYGGLNETARKAPAAH